VWWNFVHFPAILQQKYCSQKMQNGRHLKFIPIFKTQNKLIMAAENDFLSTNDFTNDKLPSSLNVLTILTFIGSGIGLIGSVYSYFTADKNYKTMQDTLSSGKLDEAPAVVKNMVSADTLPMYQKMAENKTPILLITLLSLALCIYGAIQMRKRKKQGFPVYVAGEVLPFVGTLVFVGTMAFKGFGLLSIIIPILFIILYAVNRKHLVN